MDRSYSILIYPRQGTRIRHLVVTRKSIRVLICAVLTLLALGGWLLGDYLLMKLEREEMRSVRAQLKYELTTLRARVRVQRGNVLNLNEHIENNQRLLTELKLERDGLKILGGRLKKELAAMDAKHREEVTGLSAKYNKEMNKLRVQVEQHREKLLALQDRAAASQKLLASWKGLRKKVADSLPRKRRSSLTGQQIVGELETTFASIQGELEGLIDSVPTEWPAKGWLSSLYGRRRSPWTGKSQFHSGIDIANRRGTPVYASGDAVVKFTGRIGGNGRTVVLEHGQGITTRYGHLSKIYVKKGDRVRKNQKIGKVGNTGKSTNPHLHYEVRVNGTPINPRSHLLKSKSPPS